MKNIPGIVVLYFVFMLSVASCEMKKEGYNPDKQGLRPVVERLWCGTDGCERK